MSDPVLGIVMLSLIVLAIMLGFPTAFTLMGLGMLFGFLAYHLPGQALADNRIFDLMVERTYGVMTNDTLLSVPLFVLMGYLIERAALVDKMFVSVQLAFKRLPASLAVTTMLVCTFWGIASGIVGAVVVLMGVVAMRPMLAAGYDTRLAAGVITAGGTLGILIPPSVLLIVYAAVAGESPVRMYAAAMIPGFFLAFLYFVYIVGWAMLNPRIAPKLDESKFVVPLPAWLKTAHTGPALLGRLLGGVIAPRRLREQVSEPVRYCSLLGHAFAALLPLVIALTLFGLAWWYMHAHRAAPVPIDAPAISIVAPVEAAQTDLAPLDDSVAAPGEEQELELLGSDASAAVQNYDVPEAFYIGYAALGVLTLLALAWFYSRMRDEHVVVLRMLATSVMPLAILTLVVLGVILLGYSTATESAAVGAFGALLLGVLSRQLSWTKLKESTFLTAKTTAMVCWLFVGSSLFSGVFALHGGQQLIESWVTSMDLTPLQFMLLAQALIFLLGWPLEWTEIIVIFVPIFLPLLAHFDINPILFGTLVAVNLQAAFLSPPVAMSAFYLKGVSPPHVTLNQIFAGMMPYMLIVILCMVCMYIWPGMTLWLPEFVYGR